MSRMYDQHRVHSVQLYLCLRITPSNLVQLLPVLRMRHRLSSIEGELLAAGRQERDLVARVISIGQVNEAEVGVVMLSDVGEEGAGGVDGQQVEGSGLPRLP